jgi:hypothetical protein
MTTNESRGVLRHNTVVSLLAILLLVACTETTLSPPHSTWGEIFTIGQAQQTAAPAVWPFDDRVLLAWIGADAISVFQTLRTYSRAGLSDPVALALPRAHPYAQQLLPAEAGYAHLLWLDADVNSELRLWAALIDPLMAVERGPTEISEEAAWNYAALPNGDGSLWAISGGGLLAEPCLSARYVDVAGRPRMENVYQVAFDADWPALVRDQHGQMYLFWIGNVDGQVYYSPFADGIADHPVAVTHSVFLSRGDRLDDFTAGLDHTHLYLFWNITRAEGSRETWFTAGARDSHQWNAPSRLGLDVSATERFETGFNSGAGQVARAGQQWLSWVRPLHGPFGVLGLAAVLESKQLVMVYLREGAVVGYQPVAPVTTLLGAPNIVTDRDRHLYLTWADAAGNEAADLKLTMTRRFE